MELFNIMTKEQANLIKNKIEEINKTNSSIILLFDMAQHSKIHSDDNWFVTIIHHITEEEWIEFATLEFNFHKVLDMLYGWENALVAMKYYQEMQTLKTCVIQ